MIKVPTDIDECIRLYKEEISFDKNFDVIFREFKIGMQKSCLFLLDGDAASQVTTQIMRSFLEKQADVKKKFSADEVMSRLIPFVEVDAVDDMDEAIYAMMVGAVVLMIDGTGKAYIIDAKNYPQRDTSEPEKDKVIRGSRDGFVEITIFNAALIRRRIQSKHLMMERFSVGKSSRSDVVVSYMDDRCDKRLLQKIKDKIENISIDALTMNQESLSESLFPPKWYNPLPKVRYSERPDKASAALLEGNIVIIVDNSPSVMILPAAMVDFLSEANDYYFPPFTGTYYRIVKTLLLIISIFLTPTWLWLLNNEAIIPPWLEVVKIKEPAMISVAVQLLIMEIVFEITRISTLNSPNVLGNAIGIVGGLLVGDFAVKSGWASAETVFFMAFLEVSIYACPSFELGYALKFFRMFLIIMTALFDLAGLITASALIFILTATTKTVAGTGYFYPICPLDVREILRNITRGRLQR